MLQYDLHGLKLALQIGEGWPQAAAALQARLASIPSRETDAPPDLKFEVRRGSGTDHGLERPDRSRSVYDPPLGEVVYDDEADLLYIEHGPRLRALCEPAAGRARFSALDPDENDLWLLSHPLFSLPLVETLKRRGLYSLHAAGLAANGRALLLPGTSGTGKSTLSVALARAGLGFLGDDTLFLATREEGLRVLAFPDEIDLTEQSVAFFPEVVPWLTATGGWRKRQLRPERLSGSQSDAEIVWRAAPGVLVFPQISGRRKSRLEPIDAGEALLELVPNVLLTEPSSSQAHLDALAALARSSRCYRLATGTDLDGAVRLLLDLLEEKAA